MQRIKSGTAIHRIGSFVLVCFPSGSWAVQLPYAQGRRLRIDTCGGRPKVRYPRQRQVGPIFVAWGR